MKSLAGAHPQPPPGSAPGDQTQKEVSKIRRRWRISLKLLPENPAQPPPLIKVRGVMRKQHTASSLVCYYSEPATGHPNTKEAAFLCNHLCWLYETVLNGCRTEGSPILPKGRTSAETAEKDPAIDVRRCRLCETQGNGQPCVSNAVSVFR